jgi:hypothetical protein
MLESILNHCHRTVAGTRSMLYVPHEWVKTFPHTNPGDTVFFEQIEIEPDKSWMGMKIIPYIHRMERNSAQNRTVQGNDWQNTLPLYLPYKSTDIETMLNIMCQYRWIVAVAGADIQEYQVFGTKQSPLTFTYLNKSGVNAKNFAGYELNFSGIQALAPFFLIV